MYSVQCTEKGESGSEEFNVGRAREGPRLLQKGGQQKWRACVECAVLPLTIDGHNKWMNKWLKLKFDPRSPIRRRHESEKKRDGRSKRGRSGIPDDIHSSSSMVYLQIIYINQSCWLVACCWLWNEESRVGLYLANWQKRSEKNSLLSSEGAAKTNNKCERMPTTTNGESRESAGGLWIRIKCVCV